MEAVNVNESVPREAVPQSAKDTARQKAVQRLLQDRTRQDWEWTLGSEHGRRCLQNILAVCHPDADLQAGRFTDDRAQQTAIGARTVGLWLRQQVRAIDPSLVERMAYEHALPPDGDIVIPDEA